MSNTGVNASEYLLFAERDFTPALSRVELARRLKEGPESLDWVAQGKTLHPLEQGDCASCWAMATVSSCSIVVVILTPSMNKDEITDETY